MSEQDNILLTKITRQLKNSSFNIVGIYLFGSRARSTFNKDSDYDIAVILSEKIDWKVKDRIQSIIYDIMLEYDIVIDSHIYTKSEIESAKTPFRESIIKEGIYYAC